MRTTFGTAELAHPNPALGRVGTVGLALNGRQLVDEVEFFRAARLAVFARGVRSQEASFAVHRFFASEAAALVFATTHHNDLPNQADLILTLDGQTVALANAALQGVQREEWSGCYVRMRYTFIGSAWSTDASPLPDPDPDMTRRANLALDTDATSVAVVFSSALSGVPFVQATVLMPTVGGDVIFASVIEDTITAAGFTAALSGPVPGAGYKLSYRAEV
jgi:hypothetical protein